MKLLTHFIKLINENNVTQLEIDCQKLQKLQEVLSPNKIRLFDYQHFINELIQTAADSGHDNPQLLEQLLTSNPSSEAVSVAANTAFLKKHAKQFGLLLQDKNLLNLPTNGRASTAKLLARALNLAQVELGRFQSNTNLIAQSLKALLVVDPRILSNWLQDLIDGKMTNPLNDKQTENFKNALKTLTDPSIKNILINNILGSNQVAHIENKANELIKKLIAQIKKAKIDDDNIPENWYADVIWYIKNKDQVMDADQTAKKDRVCKLLTEQGINLDLYLNNPLGIDPSLNNCEQTTVRTHFVNSCIEHLENRNVVDNVVVNVVDNIVDNEDDLDFNFMQAAKFAGFNNPELFSYKETQISDKATCNNLMSVFAKNRELLSDLMNLIEIQSNSLLYAAIKHGNRNIDCFTEYDASPYCALNSEKNVYPYQGSCTLLHLAVVFNPSAITPLSRLKGFDVNAKDSEGYTALHLAAKVNPVALGPLLEIEKIDVNAPTSTNETALSLVQKFQPEHLQLLLARADLIIDPSMLVSAIYNNQLTLLNHLLTKNVSVITIGHDDNTPLHLAAMHFPEAIEPLSKKLSKDQLNARNIEGRTPLHLAATRNPKSVAALLKISGVDVNASDTRGYTPVRLGFSWNVEAAKQLLSVNGINVNLKPEKGEALLIHVSSHAPNFVIPVLKCIGVDATVTDQFKNTALHLNVAELDIVKFLLTIAPNLVNAQNESGKTPVHLAVMQNSKTLPLFAKVAELDPNLQDKNGDTILHKAVASDLVGEVLKFNKINVNIKNDLHLTPLLVAAQTCAERLRLLLAVEATDVNAKNRANWTALHFACFNGNESAVRALLAREDIDVNTQTTDGETPLMLAAKRRQPTLIELLLRDKRVKTNITNNERISALEIATKCKNEKAISMLTEAIQKAEELFTATNIIEVSNLLANSKFLLVAKEQKHSKNFLDLGKNQHSGRHVACDAFCAVINYLKTPQLLTFKGWLIDKMKEVIKLDVEMFNTFVTLVTTNELVNPFSHDAWQTWVIVVNKAVGDKPSESLQKSLEALQGYVYPTVKNETAVVAVATQRF